MPASFGVFQCGGGIAESIRSSKDCFFLLGGFFGFKFQASRRTVDDFLVEPAAICSGSLLKAFCFFDPKKPKEPNTSFLTRHIP